MADAIKITVDTRGLERLAQEYERAGRFAIIRLLEAGEEFIREEAPERTGNLKGKRNAGGSVTSDYRQTGTGYLGEINVSAIRERLSATTAEAVSPKGRRRTIRLRAQKPFNYAEAVATGRPRLTAPRQAQAFLIPVQSAPVGQGYIVARGQIFIVRKSVGPQQPNDYPGRALTRLGAVAERIVTGALRDVGLTT